MKDKVRKPSKAIKNSVPILCEQWIYYGGDGRGKLKQNDRKFTLFLTWSPNDKPGPHYRLEGSLSATREEGIWRITGTWQDIWSDSRRPYSLAGVYNSWKEEIRLPRTQDPRSEFLREVILTPLMEPNPLHVTKLREGGNAWNRWRITEPSIQPQLTNLHFRGRRLIGANLSYADLSFADLQDCHLAGTTFRNSILTGANLSGADLTEADLTDANLRGANLQEACLRRATLIGTNLSEATLADTDVDGARLRHTTFCKVALSKLRHLDEALLIGGNYVDLHTISQSQAVPKRFLENCSASADIFERLPLLVRGSENRLSVFISYTSEDDAVAQKIERELRGDGVRAYIFLENMRVGEPTKAGDKIRTAIERHDKFLILLSPRVVKSQWVREEVAIALKIEKEKGEFIIPVEIESGWSNSQRKWVQELKGRDCIICRNWKQRKTYRNTYDELLRLLTSPVEGRERSCFVVGTGMEGVYNPSLQGSKIGV